jgi:hypothetical protein
MSDVLADRFTITLDTDEYVFRIPSIRYDVELGYRAADVRRRCYPDAGGMLGGVDYAAVAFSRACAILELYLISANTLWPYGFSDDDLSKVDVSKPPKVDFEKFPLSSADQVVAVGEAFEREYTRFRTKRPANSGPTGT